MSQSRPMVLLVEDEADVRNFITAAVESEALRIELAGNYSDGLILLNASDHALLIADARLPDGDGCKLAEIARRRGVPALLVSGHPEAGEEARVRGIAFLAKPLRLTDLVRMIRSLIEGSPMIGASATKSEASRRATRGTGD